MCIRVVFVIVLQLRLCWCLAYILLAKVKGWRRLGDEGSHGNINSDLPYYPKTINQRNTGGRHILSEGTSSAILVKAHRSYLGPQPPGPLIPTRVHLQDSSTTTTIITTLQLKTIPIFGINQQQDSRDTHQFANMKAMRSKITDTLKRKRTHQVALWFGNTDRPLLS